MFLCSPSATTLRISVMTIKYRLSKAANFCIFTLIVFLSHARAADPIFISMVQLLANPEKFDGANVAVMGYCVLDIPLKNNPALHGSAALYLHREDSTANLSKNGVVLEVNLPILEKAGDYNKRYVLIKGVFDAKNLGFMKMYSGSIHDIEGILPWQGPLALPVRPKK